MDDDSQVTRVFTAKCPKCGDTVYSRYVEDTRWCRCKYLYVTGGTDYFETGFRGVDQEDVGLGEARLLVSQDELYDDWKTGEDKYGIL